MEDPEYSEWIIQEYSSSKEDEGGSMVKWILNKGYVMVRKIAVTGVVISSAPLVVPPLVVASAMGFAFSVPFGLLFAGYACTNKLMNILLPTPPSPPPLMLEYYYADEYDQPAEMDSMVDSKLGFDDKEDDNRQMDDNVMNHEIVLELDDGSGDYKHEGAVLIANVEEDVDEKENVNEGYLEEEDDSLEYELKGDEPLVDENDNNNEVEVNEDAKLRDEERVEDVLGVGESDSDVFLGDVKDVETTKVVRVEEIDSQKLESDEKDENDNKLEVNEDAKLRDEGDLGGSESGSNVAFGDIKDVETTKVVRVEEIDSQKLESDEKIVSESMGTEGITGGSASKDESEDAILRTMEEHLIHWNADSLEIGDIERDTNITFETLEAVSEVKENAAAENVDTLTRSPLKRDTDDAENASKTYKKMPSKEENLDDEKIWEKIRAMRTLVGYKAPSHPTCIGELKALYVFTGVEPPASFEGDSDPDEVNAKLKFLMAIVGVK